MFKRMFQFSSNESETPAAAHNAPGHSLDMAELSSALQREAESSGAGPAAGVGPVLESFDDHSVLSTDQLNYTSKQGHFYTRLPVTVRRPGAVIHGEGLEATPDLSEIRIFRQRSVMSSPPR